MSAKVDQICDRLRDRLNTIEAWIESVKTHLEALPEKDRKAHQSKLEVARAKLQAEKERVEQTRAELKSPPESAVELLVESSLGGRRSRPCQSRTPAQTRPRRTSRPRSTMPSPESTRSGTPRFLRPWPGSTTRRNSPPLGAPISCRRCGRAAEVAPFRSNRVRMTRDLWNLKNATPREDHAMSTVSVDPRMPDLRHDLDALRGEWGWFALLGVALVVLGLVALGSLAVASLATAIVIGSLLVIGGVAEVGGAFWCRAWSGFFFHLLAGLLSAVVGLLFLAAPVDALFALTLILAVMLLVGGIFNVVAAVSYRFSGWGLLLLSGVVDMVLGVMIWQAWPASAWWVVGLFVGINLIFRGINWISLGLTLRNLPRASTA
jgi:uncharacterized membrane protein HdeD (DUF308 family)